MKNIIQVLKNIKYLIVTLLMLMPTISFAHVQWFVSPEEMKQVSFKFDWLYYTITLTVLTFAFLAILITRSSYKNKLLNYFISCYSEDSKNLYTTVFSLCTVLFFLLMLIKGGFIAPNLNLPTKWIGVGVFLQAMIVLLACVSISLSGFAVLVSTLFMMMHIPLFISINYAFEFLAVGTFMFLTGHYLSNVDRIVVKKLQLDKKKMWCAAVTVLRIGIGLQLIILAFTEKLVYPGLALVFVEMFPFYNFFPSIGFEMMTDLHFVFFIGFCELILGILLIFGVANRLVMIMLTCAFVTTAVIHGAHEIEGHLPIFGAAFVLLFELCNKTNISKESKCVRLFYN